MFGCVRLFYLYITNPTLLPLIVTERYIFCKYYNKKIKNPVSLNVYKYTNAWDSLNRWMSFLKLYVLECRKLEDIETAK